MSSDIESWPPPDNANAFESLCLDLWKEIWNDPSAQKNGRSGQSQAGVDVFGLCQGKHVGVQCKQKDNLLRSRIKVRELEREVEEAKNFRPILSAFVLATTGPRDGRIQERARLLTENHKRSGLFSVEVWSWEDIWHELYQRQPLFDRIAPTYWPRLTAAKAKQLKKSQSTPTPRKKVALVIGGTIISLIFLGYLISHFYYKLKPKPHFALSLRIGDAADSTVLLTNDFLSMLRFKRIGDLPNSGFVFNGHVDGCIVIPVHPGESNKVFNFIAENDSPVKVTDLQAAVAFNKDWSCLPDAKWHSADLFLVFQEAWKLSFTNLQGWAIQSPWVLLPWDSLAFPSITNQSVAAYNGPKSKSGFISVNLRSSGLQETIAANVIFFPSSSNFSKPFVTRGSFDLDGTFSFDFPIQ